MDNVFARGLLIIQKSLKDPILIVKIYIEYISTYLWTFRPSFRAARRGETFARTSAEGDAIFENRSLGVYRYLFSFYIYHEQLQFSHNYVPAPNNLTV